MLKSNYKNTLIVNSLIELGDDLSADTKGKGRKFVSRFIEAGVAHYEEFGDILITKETLDKFIDTMVGCPVIIKHKDIDDKNVDKERVGVVSKVWYDDKDGWFYCEGIIWDKQAIDLVKNQGWNVSCTYDFDSDKQAKTHNGKKIDMEFTGGEFLHLALVPNPRYERANIVLNSKDIVENDYWITIGADEEEGKKGHHVLVKDGETHKEATERKVKEWEGKKEDKTKRREIEHNGAKISIIPDGKYSDIKIDAPEGKTFKNGDTWYSTQAETEKAEEHAKRIIEGEFGKPKKEDTSSKEKESKQEVIEKATKTLTSNKFIPNSQKSIIKKDLKGEEYEHFVEKIDELAKVIEKAPKMYETDGVKLKDKKPILHYFGGNYDNYVYEIDKKTGEMFGAVNMGYGYELGYSSMEEINSVPKIELDLYFDGKQPKELTNSSYNSLDSIIDNALMEVIVENCLGE